MIVMVYKLSRLITNYTRSSKAKKMKIKYTLFFAALLLFGNCSDMNNQRNVVLEKVVFLGQVPSASALGMWGDSIYIAGDDASSIYQFDANLQLTDTYPLLPHFAGLQRIPKPLKPDIESMAEGLVDGKYCLALFGSGSLSPQRDSMYLFFPAEPGQSRAYDLGFLYRSICDITGIADDALNIEGAVIAGDTLHLFNRGRNFIASVSWPALLAALEAPAPTPLTVDIKAVALPPHNGIQMGFSGACLVPGENWILFTATVEDTDNWYDDGEILGSYVGGLRLTVDGKAELLWLAPVTTPQGDMAIDKLESIACLSGGNPLRALAVTDNDDGTSKLLELTIDVNKESSEK